MDYALGYAGFIHSNHNKSIVVGSGDAEYFRYECGKCDLGSFMYDLLVGFMYDLMVGLDIHVNKYKLEDTLTVNDLR
jgi:hypothetical protein